jgi:hypothetical protein
MVRKMVAALPVHLADRLDYQPPALHVQPARGSSRNRIFGRWDDGTADTHPLLHPFREGPDRQMPFLGQPHPGKDLIDPVVPLGPGHAVHLPAEVQVLFCGEVTVNVLLSGITPICILAAIGWR